MTYFKNILMEFIYFFYNHIVNHIPFWTVRKLLYIMSGMKIGKKSRILLNTVVIKPWKISVGDRTYINEFCHLDGRGGLKIGDDTSLSVYTAVITGTHDSCTFEYKEDGVTIGNNVWIGARVNIMPGSVLEDKVLVGAGSTIKKGVYRSDGFYSGVPALLVRKRNSEKYRQGTWKPWFR